MDIVTKDFAVLDAGESDEYPNGAFEVVLSAPTKDRDGEVVDSKAFEPLPDHITFDTDHSMTCDSVVGSGRPSYAEDGTLRVKGGYCSDERSQIIRQKVKDGHIRTTSVTFMAAQRVDDEKGVPHVVKAELLNGTFTPVPSNREAVVLSAKSIVAHEVAAKVGARNNAKDSEVIQGMHDSSVALGAACGEKSTKPSAGEFKSVVGSLEATQDRVRDALNDAYGENAWVWLRATLDGSCVFEVSTSDGSECETYQQSFTDDGSVVTLTGDRSMVDLQETIVPDADEATEPEGASASDTAQSADKDATSSAADKAAEPDASKSADEGSEKAARWGELKNQADAIFGDA